MGLNQFVTLCQPCSDLSWCGSQALKIDDFGIQTPKLNLEKVTYGILEGLGYEVKAAADEKDAASMVAKGSAWARVGDTVKTSDGDGIVQEIHKDGSATVAIAGKDASIYKKEDYSKVF